MPIRARVALLRSDSETVLHDYERLLDLAGIRDHLDPSAATILVAAIGRRFPFPSANTTPWQFAAIARALRSSYTDLAFVLRQAVPLGLFQSDELNGYGPIGRAYSLPIHSLDQGGDSDWVPYEPRASRAALRRFINGPIRVPGLFVGKNIVGLPTLRCAAGGGSAGALAGFCQALHPRFHPARPWPAEALVDLLALQRELTTGQFVVMDGTTAGVPGRSGIEPVVRNIILASSDPVALDVVAAHLMGFDPSRTLAYARLADQRGLGVGDARAIALLGDADLVRERWRFDSVDLARSAGARLALLLDRALPPYLRDLYDALYRWPARDRDVFESWLRDTGWGWLFQRYQRSVKR